MRAACRLCFRVSRRAGLHLAICVIATQCCSAAWADVIVLANRTDRPLPVRFMPVAGQAQNLNLPPGDVTPMFLDGGANLVFSSPGGPKRYPLDPNCAYYFGRTQDGRIDLQKIGLGENEESAKSRSLPGSASRTPSAVIPVKILVDEEEPGRKVLWEQRLRRRIEAASAVLEKHCRVGLRVVAVDTWNSDNRTNDFIASLGEFEREVQPSPARLAIGFTSQWQMVRGRTHMAGTRGPLHSHILVREGSPQISEPERLEFLVHELGHYLGASHSPERGSVMRPVLGDKQAGRSDFKIQFDPVNTLVIAMVGEEIRRRNVLRLAALTPDSKRRLKQIYTELARSLPNDPASSHYVQMMSAANAPTPLALSAKAVLREVVRAAVANRALPEANGGNPMSGSRRTGDALTEYYVRAAARAADSLPADVDSRAFLVALGIALDDSNLLAKLPGAASLAASVEAPNERAVRLNALGEPTVRGRRDLAQHYFVSGYLTATMGANGAQAAGIAKELLDAHTASGFSFADLAADRAGVKFAESAMNRRLKLNLLAQGFRIEPFMPEVDGLPEGLTAVELAEEFGTQTDPRFINRVREIDERINRLPPYRNVVARGTFSAP